MALNLDQLTCEEASPDDENLVAWLDQLSDQKCSCGKQMLNGEVEYIGMCCECDKKLREERDKEMKNV